MNPGMDRRYLLMGISDTAEWPHLLEKKMREKEEKPSPEVRRRSNAPTYQHPPHNKNTSL